MKNEKDFNNWLADNIDFLSKVLGMDLDVLETESEVREFYTDIVTRDVSIIVQAILSDFRRNGRRFMYLAISVPSGKRSTCSLQLLRLLI